MNRKKRKTAIFFSALLFAFGVTLKTSASSYPSVFYNSDSGDDLWTVEYPGAGKARISQVNDSKKGKVIRIYDADNWSDGTFRLQGYDPVYNCDIRYKGNVDGCMGVDMQYKLNFSVKSNENFVVRVYLKSAQRDDSVQKRNFQYYNYRVLEYVPTADGYVRVPWSYDQRYWFSKPYYDQAGIAFDDHPSCAGDFLRKGIGTGLTDGKWHDVSVDLASDLAAQDPGNHVVEIEKIEVFGGDVYLDDVYLDFRSAEMETFGIDDGLDPTWTYDSGWLDTHEFGDTFEETSCVGGGELKNDGVINGVCDENAEVIDYTSCSYVHKDAFAEIRLDLSDLPKDTMNCSLIMNNFYTYNDGSDYQFYENLLAEVESAGGIKTSQIIYDAGEGWHQVTTSEPLILEKGVNILTLKSPGWCTAGDSVSFGYCSASVGSRDQGKCGNKAFRLKCDAKNNAVNLNFSSNPALIEEGQTSTLAWDTENASKCIPTAGFIKSSGENDWQAMAPVWADLKKNPDGTSNTNWPYYGATFLTNALPYSISYGLGCYDGSNKSYVEKSLMVSTYSSTMDGSDTCTNYEWNNVTESAYAGTPLSLSASTNYRLYIKHKEPYAYLDKLIITNDASYNPVGTLGTADVAVGKNKAEMEAEDYDYMKSWAFEEVSDYTASGTIAINVDSGDNVSANNKSSFMAYDFTVPSTGNYYLWGRAGRNDESGGTDSFWVAVKESPLSDYEKDVEDLVNNHLADIKAWTFDSAPIQHCAGFDFWIGNETDESQQVYGSDVMVGDSVNVWWQARNVNSCIASGDDNWGGLKSADNIPSIHGDTVTPLASGNKVYYLECFDGEGISFGKKEVRLSAIEGFNVAINGECGRPKVASDGPVESMTCSAGVLADPPGITYDKVNKKWNWVCDGLNGGENVNCSVKDLSGWIEK